MPATQIVLQGKSEFQVTDCESQRKILTQCAERIQNDRDINRLLKQGAFDNRKVTEGGSHHRSQRQGQTYIDTLQRNGPGTLGDLHCLGDTSQIVHEQDCIGRFGGCRRAAHSHGNADVCRREGWRVIDPVPCHQHNTIGTFRNHDVHLLAWQQL